MIEFKNLSVGFNNKTLLKDLDGKIEKGQLIALMGVNGAGKSCLLKTLTALNPKRSGELSLDKVSYESSSPLDLAKKMAVVLTEKIHADFLKVIELIHLGRSPYTDVWGNLSDADSKSIFEVISLLKLERIQNNFFSELSDGQKQKVLLARALVQAPQYLFLDEPTTYLDIPSKVELMKTLKQLSHEKQMAVFFSTHDLNLIEDVVDFIWLIDADGVLHIKSPEDLRSSGLLKTNFNI